MIKDSSPGPSPGSGPLSAQLTVRVAILGGVAFALFAIIFFRLWFLEVLSGDHYLAQANDNRVRDVRVQAPRGDIVDRNGTRLVDNRIAIAVTIEPRKLPPAGSQRRALYRRLGRALDMRAQTVQQRVIEQRKLVPYANVKIKTDATRATYEYLLERQGQFPGVTVQRVYLRSYPHKLLAAQLFGTVGEISPKELKRKKFRGAAPGTIVGKGGIEYTYDRYLRGRDGATRIQVDALGRPKGELAVSQPVQGKQLKLSVDLKLQRAGQQAMAAAVGLANKNGNPALAGAFVALDPRNGEVLAMGSYPSFDPNVFAKPLSQKAFNALNSEANGAPLFNRAIQGLYPTGSTFKLVTATAALQSGVITPETAIDDPGKIKIGDVVFQNAGGVANGTVSLRRALQVSSDVFFYRLGQRLNFLKGQVLQHWARQLGLGRRTGIDLPGEFAGLIPSAAWRNRLYREGKTDRPWSVGDNVNLAVGQGDMQATPLQMAVAYATLANGGRVVRPHLGMQVEDSAGRTLQRLDVAAARRVDISALTRSAILDGLRLAASAPGGTSADVFKGFSRTVYGKTGTAERPGQADQSWYVCYSPDPRRPIVLAVTVEKGGFGAEAAAPAARLMLSEWFKVKKKLVVGSSKTR